MDRRPGIWGWGGGVVTGGVGRRARVGDGTGLGGIFADDVCVEADVAVGFNLAIEALDFVFEAGEQIGTAFEDAEVVDHWLGRFGEAFAGDDGGDTGRVDDEHRRGDAVMDLVRRQEVDIVAGEVADGDVGRHRDFGEMADTELLALQGAYGLLAAEGVNLRTEVAQAHAAVALGAGADEFGDGVFDFGVVVVQAFEEHQGGEQRGTLAAFDPRREQEEDRVEVVLFRHDAVFTQVLRKDGRGDAVVSVVAGIRSKPGVSKVSLLRSVIA